MASKGVLKPIAYRPRGAKFWQVTVAKTATSCDYLESMIPKMPAADLIRGCRRFPGKIIPKR